MAETATSTILDAIIERTRERVAAAQSEIPLAALKARCAGMAECRDFRGALQSPRIAAIAEFKMTSPSAGVIREGASPGGLARLYAGAGARCLSVLTEPFYFSGAPEHLQEARAAISIPVLRKDFIIDPYQVYETRAMGADAMLLIACCLRRDTLEELHALGTALGLSVLVEVHDESDLAKIDALSPDLVGVNNRNLRIMQTDLAVSLRLKSALPAGAVTVSESGIKTRADVERLEAAGYDAILVGEHLMRAGDPGEELRMLLRG